MINSGVKVESGRISVIVTAYNVGPYLDKCLESIEKQSCASLEIIVVNDGSTDESQAIAARRAASDKRLKIINKTNSGAAAARNAGIDAASGDYIVFVDGDDWIEADCLKILLELAKEHDADISCCGLRSHGMTAKNYNPEESPAADSGRINVYTNIEALSHVRFMNCGKLFRRKLFENTRYPEGRTFEDEFTVYRLIFGSNRVVVTGRQLYNRNVRQGSLTRSGVNLKNLDVIDALEERAKFYGEKGLEDLRVKTEKSIVGTIARIMVKNRAGAGSDKRTINEMLEQKLDAAIKKFRSNKNTSLRQKTEVFAYAHFPSAAVFAAGLRNRFIIKNEKN